MISVIRKHQSFSFLHEQDYSKNFINSKNNNMTPQFLNKSPPPQTHDQITESVYQLQSFSVVPSLSAKSTLSAASSSTIELSAKSSLAIKPSFSAESSLMTKFSFSEASF